MYSVKAPSLRIYIVDVRVKSLDIYSMLNLLEVNQESFTIWTIILYKHIRKIRCLSKTAD